MPNTGQETGDTLVIPEDVAGREASSDPKKGNQGPKRKPKKKRRNNKTRRVSQLNRKLAKYRDVPESLRRPIVDNGNDGICQQVIDNIRDSMRDDAGYIPAGETGESRDDTAGGE